ncbi:MAG: MFS transporter [Dehalococcoidia bacterium]|nr:MAG: MFS transporter [Dehalococcoidia bacterium]
MMALLPPLLPFIRRGFSLSYTQAGGLISAHSIAYGISQFPAGLIADRVGSRTLLTIGVVGAALAGLLIGFSPNYIVMALLLVVMGLTGGGYHPSASPLVSASVRPEHRGRALGIHQIGGTVSFFLAPLIAAGIASALGWRGTFITTAIPTLSLGIVFHLLLGKMGYAGSAQRKGAEASVPAPSEPGDRRRLSAFIAIGIASMVLLQSTLKLTPLYAVDVLGASEEQGAALLSIAYFGGIWGGPLGGLLSDRLGRIPVIIAVGLISGPAIYLLNHVSLDVSLYAVLLLMGTAMHVGMPVVESYIIGHVSPQKRSTVLGLYYMVSRGGPAITFLLGHLIDSYQFFITLSGVSIIMLAVAIASTALLWGKRG